MSRKKKHTSAVLEKAQARLAALKSINPSLDMGNGLSVEMYGQLVDDGRQRLEAYNITLSTVDQTYTSLMDFEKVMAEWTERMLLGVASTYGKNSEQYKMAGGTRRSDRKRPRRPAAPSLTSKASAIA
jgi:hypothetical protein